MADDLEKKFATMPGVGELALCWPTQGQAAQNEGSGIEGELLATCCALFAGKADRFHLLEFPFRDPEPGKNLAHLGKGRICRSW
jgi:hypothetical protein